MTIPFDLIQTSSNRTDESMDDLGAMATSNVGPETKDPEYPAPILELDKEKKEKLKSWLEDWIEELKRSQSTKLTEWADIEQQYRAKPDPPTTIPFVGACTDKIPVVAMAVEPVHARMETGIFKQDPVFRVKMVRKSLEKYRAALEEWVNLWMLRVAKFQREASPRMLESCKLGTMVFKVPYVIEKTRYKTYDAKNKVVDKEATSFQGPRAVGVELGDLLFPALLQNIQDSPIVVEKQRVHGMRLRELEFNKFLTNVDKLEPIGTNNRNELEDEREEGSNHESAPMRKDEYELYECWFRYDMDGDGYPEAYVATYSVDAHEFLQLRYNPYFHQNYPYVVIPYTITNQSIYGIGIGEMAVEFQRAITSFHRMSIDNAFVANMRMFKAKRNTPGIAEKMKLYPGKTFMVDDTKDLEAFQAGEIYPSTISERNNLFGMVEKRTGVSDYMTGRESPVLGSRATATSTLALIQEGTRRVEQVMENVRSGFNEIVRFHMLLWAQYGVGKIDDYVFKGEDTSVLVEEFFRTQVTPENVDTLLAIDLGVTDATTNRQVQQQQQLGLIQIITQYLQQLIQVGQLAMQAKQAQPELAAMIKDVVESAQKMYRDLLVRYDSNNAAEYLPDVTKYFEPAAQPGAPIGANGGDSGGFADVFARLGGIGGMGPGAGVPDPAAGAGGAGPPLA